MIVPGAGNLGMADGRPITFRVLHRPHSSSSPLLPFSVFESLSLSLTDTGPAFSGHRKLEQASGSLIYDNMKWNCHGACQKGWFRGEERP